ncbi:MAG: enoyl-CoA hydratase-related protein [Acidimicrobiales bacterium]
MTDERVHVETADGYAVLTLDDPARRNALSVEMGDELVEAMEQLEATPQLAAIVITGAPPAFCAGADLAQLEGADEAGLRSIYAGFERIARSHLLTVAAVNGAAVGAGMNMTLACDVRIAGERARFDTRFLALGLHPGGAHTWMLQRAVSYGTAAALLLGAESVPGPDAARLGLAYRCVPDDQLLEVARQFVAVAASAGPELVRRVKASLAAARGGDFGAALDHELVEQLWSARQPLFAERIAALRRRIGSGR